MISAHTNQNVVLFLFLFHQQKAGRRIKKWMQIGTNMTIKVVFKAIDLVIRSVSWLAHVNFLPLAVISELLTLRTESSLTPPDCGLTLLDVRH